MKGGAVKLVEITVEALIQTALCLMIVLFFWIRADRKERDRR